MKRLVFVLVGLALATLPASAQDAQDILRRTAEVYQGMQEYRFDANVSIEMEGTVQQAMDVGMVIAARKPDHVRIEMNGPKVSLIIVTNGDSTWTYMPHLKQYMAAPGGLNPGELGASVPDFLAEYSKIADGVQSAEILREESVQIEGQSYPSYVVRVQYEPGSGIAQADSTAKTVWIDEKQHLILRDETRAYLTNTPFGGPVHLNETRTIHSFTVGEPLSASLFAFNPPADVSRVEPQEAQQEATLEGKPAYDFELERLDGGTMSLASLRGKVVLVNFWATWCGPCRVEMPMLQKLYEEYRDEGFEVVAVSVGEPRTDVAPFVKTNGFTFPVLLDQDTAIANAYMAGAIPMSVIIDRDGVVRHLFSGAAPEEVVRRALQDVGIQ
ncbi:MAG TPA: redoxin domain-containing protein [Rhodothermales bacterium]|nr:redoxin domain-containing protein [Rhodothermales bacterium]